MGYEVMKPERYPFVDIKETRLVPGSNELHQLTKNFDRSELQSAIETSIAFRKAPASDLLTDAK